MKKNLVAAIAVVSGALALTGCSGLQTSASAPSRTGVESPTSASVQSSSSDTPAPSPVPTAFPEGQPPRQGVPNTSVKPDTVPGLTEAIAQADHPGLQICNGDIDSFVIAQGDLRGNGGIQYLVDTTCNGATATTPDEASLYDVRGGSIARSAVIYEFSANRPRTTQYPYLWKDHFVVLTYDEGKSYRLVLLTPDKVVPGIVQSFH